jgi:transketolase
MSVTIRDAYGKKLVELGAVHKDIVVLDADVSGSTKSSYFAKEFPGRFFNCGVSEGNMAGVAAGLAAAGFHPVINAFAIFLALKSTDQIRNDFCYNKLPVVLAGAYGGLSDSFDGASHQSITDIAIMRAMPNMEVIVPGDKTQVEQALEYAVSRKGPVYIRLSRNEACDLPPPKDFSSKAPVLLRKGRDVTIAVSGIPSAMTLEAADILAKGGVEAEVFCLPFIKPLEAAELAQSLRKTGKLVTVEEHNIIGGVGSACLEALNRIGVNFSYCPIGIEDTFTETGPYDRLLAVYGLSAKAIAEKIRQEKTFSFTRS